MPSDTTESGQAAANRRPTGEYLVIARRYRPQSFDELVGQQQVAKALKNAIATGRVGHAYLFTGARGVGKTSCARILAKALNCVHGPSPQPCNACDICQSISGGEDVDVLEIDGASNRGIDEIRQLRSNVNIRPSRARFKIYIIDEVHMLTVPAFNALLKTLEEPPDHVKFLFCTTDPEKVPVTVLSRCQRFDFAPVETGCIVERLRHIVAAEGMAADEEALQLLARRANGSLRDSQSLLEQLLSFCGQKITAGDVHRLLGTAHSGRVAELASLVIARDAGAALGAVDRWIAEGVDAGQLTEQLLGWFRDMMAAAVGCGAELMLHSAPGDYGAVRDAGQRMGLETILAAVQILDHSLTRMRQSTHLRTLLETALVRICRLEALEELSELIAQLRQGDLPAPCGAGEPAAGPGVARTAAAPSSPAPPDGQKKKAEPSEGPADDAVPTQPVERLSADSAERIWKRAMAQLGDMTADHGARYDRVVFAGPDQLVVGFREAYTLDKERCERPERKARIEEALARVVGHPVRLVLDIVSDPPSPPAMRRPPLSRRERMRQQEAHPLVRRAIELFDAEITDVEEPRDREAASTA